MVFEQSRQVSREHVAPGTAPLAILFAEDSKMIRHLIEHVLAERGHQVDGVDDGEQALKALQSRAYDVALVDFHLPKLDGLEVARQFKAMSGDDRHTQFVGFTADVEGLLAHPDSCDILDLVVGKPVDIVKLCGVLEKLKNDAGQLPGRERRAARRVKVIGGATTLFLQSGERLPCHVHNLSLGGVAIDIETRPAVGQRVIVGRTEGRVVRHTPTGIALEFTRTSD